MADERPRGDPRVYWFLNIVLSFCFAWIVLWGLGFLTGFEWDWITLVLSTVIVAIVTHLFVDRA